MLRTDFSDSGLTSFLASDDICNFLLYRKTTVLGGHWLNEDL